MVPDLDKAGEPNPLQHDKYITEAAMPSSITGVLDGVVWTLYMNQKGKIVRKARMDSMSFKFDH